MAQRFKPEGGDIRAFHAEKHRNFTQPGYLSVKDDLVIDLDQARSYPDKKLVIIGTGTQGEPMSALSRMALGTHRHFKAKKGDTVIITASIIPGNERMITNVVNTIMSLGADVYYDQTEDIHVSGHGSAKELKLMLSITKPKYFMPVQRGVQAPGRPTRGSPSPWA